MRTGPIFIFMILLLTNSKLFGQHKASVVVVLCDVSKSVSKLEANELNMANPQIQLLKQIVNQIPNKFKTTSEIYYFPISQNANNKPLGKGAVKKNRVTEMEIIIENDRVKAELQKINKDIDNLSLSKDVNGTSCILTSISNGYRFLSQKKSQRNFSYNYHLIILSDMLEYCNSFTSFKIDMETDQGVNKIKTDLKSLKFDNINFDSQQIKITVVSISPNMTENKLRQVQLIWDEIFKKMGYSQKVTISSTL